ncbi:MAG: hypothetical protein FLDDKLPJ_01642 [Phycisphaerae bacterium]|nr:hypothetical protein [Phycisphaerae bacterium]
MLGMIVVIVGVGLVLVLLAARFVLICTIDDGHVGLLKRSGRFVEELPPGMHLRAGLSVDVERIDLRRHAVVLAGQDLLTKDNMTVKVSLHAEQRVVSALRTRRDAVSWTEAVYTALHLALREAVAGRTFDEMLADRGATAKEIADRVAAEAAELGVRIERVALRDVMLPADLRRAFAEVLRLREEGKAALEKARGETAALRSLANAARMLKDNPELLSMRMVQSIETVGATPGNTLVLGLPLSVPGLKNGQ